METKTGAKEPCLDLSWGPCMPQDNHRGSGSLLSVSSPPVPPPHVITVHNTKKEAAVSDMQHASGCFTKHHPQWHHISAVLPHMLLSSQLPSNVATLTSLGLMGNCYMGCSVSLESYQRSTVRTPQHFHFFGSSWGYGTSIHFLHFLQNSNYWNEYLLYP